MGQAHDTRRRFFVGIALAVAAFAGFLFVFDAGAMYRELGGVRIAPVFVGLVSVLLAVACWAESMRRVLIAAGGSVPAHRGFSAYASGMFAKQVLPMGNAGGVPIMAYAIDREADIGFDRCMAVVTVGDFLGLVSSLLLAIAGVAYVVVRYPSTRLLQAAFVGVGVFTAALLSLALLLLYRRDVLRYLVLGVARFLRGTVGKLSERVEAAVRPATIKRTLTRYFETVDAVRRQRRAMLVAAGLSIAGWTLFAVPLATAAFAVGHPVSFGLVLFVVPVGAIATLLPLPGGIGGVEFAVGGLFAVMTGAELAVAGAVVVLYRLCVYWFPILIGLFAVVYTGTSLRPVDARVEWK